MATKLRFCGENSSGGYKGAMSVIIRQISARERVVVWHVSWPFLDSSTAGRLRFAISAIELLAYETEAFTYFASDLSHFAGSAAQQPSAGSVCPAGLARR